MEPTKERSKKGQRRKQSVGEKAGDTRIDTLRQTYGDSFAPGVRGDTHLKTLLERTGSSSLSDYLKTAGRKATGIRYAPEERFKEAHRKTSALHAGLFRRLAE